MTTLTVENRTALDGDNREQDQRLRTAALARLRASGYLRLRDLHCEVHEGVVTVTGSVPSFHLKQVVQAALHRVPAVRGVRDLVEVQRDADVP